MFRDKSESFHDISIKWAFFLEFFLWKIRIQIRGQERNHNRIATERPEEDKSGGNLNKKIFPCIKPA